MIKTKNLDVFDEVLIDAVDEALTVIGESTKKILYYHIENKYLLKKQDIPNNLELFILALRSLLGAGGVLVETLILKIVCKKFDLSFESLKDKHFEDAIRDIRKKATADTTDSGKTIINWHD